MLDKFRDASFMIGPGCYALYSRGVLNYIGKSTCLAERIGAHARGESTQDNDFHGFVAIVFDEVRVLPCSIEGLDFLERSLINKYKPRFNANIPAITPISQIRDLGTGIDTELEEIERIFG